MTQEVHTYLSLDDEEQMTAVRSKQYEEEKLTRIRTEKHEIVIKTSMVTNLPVSATKPNRGPCHTLCHLLTSVVYSVSKRHCCRCRAPLHEQINENQATLIRVLEFVGCSNLGSTYSSNRYLCLLYTSPSPRD